MGVAKGPTPSLREGRRFIESLPDVALLADLTWFDEAEVWGILCRLTADTASSALIPAKTDWWVTLEETYPFGSITLFPSVKNGLSLTFPHQHYNGKTAPGLPWRTGDICVQSPQFTFRQHSLDPDPIGRTERLAWYLRRAIEWLEAAATDSLLAGGDPFELPDFPGVTRPRCTLAHGETRETFRYWAASDHRFGIAELVVVDSPRNETLVVRRFLAPGGAELLAYGWGRALEGPKRVIHSAAWLRCDHLPVVAPYQAIDSWGGIFAYLRDEGRDELFRKVTDLIRDGRSHLLLLGFPIPAEVGQRPCQLHWQPIRLPALSHGTKFRNGFRPNEQGYWLRDKYEFFSPAKQPDWHKAQNWSREATTARGRVDDALSNKCTLVVGVGAVGSSVAELLVRAGGGRIVVCDGDDVEHGNLCRHTLRLEDLGRNKAAAVAERLVGVHSHADVWSILEAFPPTDEANLALADRCDLILDCTGDDAMLHELGSRQWNGEKWFCSISLSYKASRVYVFTAKGPTFPAAEFQRQFAAWAEKDAREFDAKELVRAGAGCWHPAFPARVDDVWMLAAAALRRLEEAVKAADFDPRLVVYEQVLDAAGFQGIRRA